MTCGFYLLRCERSRAAREGIAIAHSQYDIPYLSLTERAILSRAKSLKRRDGWSRAGCDRRSDARRDEDERGA
jgi:type IV secretory pathway VirD2 relaxase